MKNTLLLPALFSITALIANGCAVQEIYKDETAMRVATPAFMVKRVIESDPFAITSFERMHEPEQNATIYIEGNGSAYDAQGELFDATPYNPHALHLASRDVADNLGYLARPCQYSGLLDHSISCDETFWGDATYNETVLSAYDTAINGMKNRYGLRSINLVGFNGGATLAATLAAHRNDVVSLRTVSGVFDMNTLSGLAPQLTTIPQQHFIGAMDDTGSLAQAEQYMAALGNTECAEVTIVEDASHDKGWVDKWPELLKENVPSCYIPPEPEFIPIQKPEPIYVPRMGGSKK